MIVADTSAIVAALVGRPVDPALADRIASAGVVHAPHLLDVEFLSALRGLTLGGVITARRADAALRDFADLRVRRHAHTALLQRVWARRHAIGAYDATFVALAEALGAALVTCDAALARALADDDVPVALYDGAG